MVNWLLKNLNYIIFNKKRSLYIDPKKKNTHTYKHIKYYIFLLQNFLLWNRYMIVSLLNVASYISSKVLLNKIFLELVIFICKDLIYC